MEKINLETILLMAGFFALAIGCIVWSKVRKAHGKSDRLTSSIVQDIRDSKPYRTLVKAEILSHGDGRAVSKGSLGSALGRAAVGGMIAGGAGAFAGAVTGKRTTKFRGETTFRLTYGDGHTEIETVMDQTPIWEKYMKLVPAQDSH